MDTAEFIAIVEGVAGLQGEEAERAVRATLTTLAERLSPAEARDLMEQPLEELLDRVADRPARGGRRPRVLSTSPSSYLPEYAVLWAR